MTRRCPGFSYEISLEDTDAESVFGSWTEIGGFVVRSCIELGVCDTYLTRI